jgi:hypothetical protein
MIPVVLYKLHNLRMITYRLFIPAALYRVHSIYQNDF